MERLGSLLVLFTYTLGSMQDSEEKALPVPISGVMERLVDLDKRCLLYTSDAADDMQCVDLGGRRIIKKRGARPAGRARNGTAP